MRGRRAQLEVDPGSDFWEAKGGPRPCGGAVPVSTSNPVATWGGEERPPPLRGRRPLVHLKGERQRTRGARRGEPRVPSGGYPPRNPVGCRMFSLLGFHARLAPPPPSGRAALRGPTGCKLWGWRCTGDQAYVPAGCRACHSFVSLGVFSPGTPAPGNDACLPSRGFMRRIYG
jgi:hypothetical protein